MMMESHYDMNNFTNIVITPMSFLCGTFFSLDGIPEALKWVVNMMPLTHTTVSYTHLDVYKRQGEEPV